MPFSKRIIWFGGQGSDELYSTVTTDAALTHAHSSTVSALLLARCHEAFIQEIDDLGRTRFETLFGYPPPQYESPEQMLVVDPTHHKNAILQDTAFVLQQLLRYLSFHSVEPTAESLSEQPPSECSGFCTGLLSAAVIACASDPSDLVRFGVEAFRLAFWIGYRSAEATRKLLEPEDIHRPCLLITKLSKDANVPDLLEDINDAVSLFLPASHFQHIDKGWIGQQRAKRLCCGQDRRR